MYLKNRTEVTMHLEEKTLSLLILTYEGWNRIINIKFANTV
jgi:hypothetical protein